MSYGKWSPEAFDQLCEIERELENHFKYRRLTARYRFWHNNAYHFIETPEDIYKVADIMLSQCLETAPAIVQRCARDLLVSLIAWVHDTYGLYSHPNRRYYDFDKHYTHAVGLKDMWKKLDLETYDRIMGHSVKRAEVFSRDTYKYEPKEGREPQPQWHCVLQWESSRKYDDEIRAAAWRYLQFVLFVALDDDGKKLYRLAKDSVERV